MSNILCRWGNNAGFHTSVYEEDGDYYLEEPSSKRQITRKEAYHYLQMNIVNVMKEVAK